ncbi:MAG TPA: DUF2007 domain-containing protein [Sphingomicrobium sp.]|jgi:hypothetical protein|nr:DUF2007 domain-containing protein [Sphingomicrobium sp.]
MLVELARFGSRVEADLARLLLLSEGVEAILFDAEMNSFGWGPMMPVRLMVLEEDREAAEQLLAEDGP